jgi:hypothetical protein
MARLDRAYELKCFKEKLLGMITCYVVRGKRVKTHHHPTFYVLKTIEAPSRNSY